MESRSLEAIKEQLQKERDQLHAKAEKLRGELATLDSDLSRIAAAIAALDGLQPSLAAVKAGKPLKERKRLLNPAAGKRDVIEYVRAILESEGVVEQSALRSLVEAQLTKAGFTRMGFSLRFKEALADAQFVDTPAGVRLKEEKAVAVES